MNDEAEIRPNFSSREKGSRKWEKDMRTGSVDPVKQNRMRWEAR